MHQDDRRRDAPRLVDVCGSKTPARSSATTINVLLMALGVSEPSLLISSTVPFNILNDACQRTAQGCTSSLAPAAERGVPPEGAAALSPGFSSAAQDVSSRVRVWGITARSTGSRTASLGGESNAGLVRTHYAGAMCGGAQNRVLPLRCHQQAV